VAGSHEQPKELSEEKATYMTQLADSIRRVSNADGAILMDLRRGTMFRVNPLGVRILDLLDSGQSPAQIAVQLSAEFGIALDRVEADIAEFFSSLEAYGVLEPPRQKR
jgi:hypothetical protein